MNRRLYFAVIIIAAVGLVIRMAAFNSNWLWQDEAETTINSMQVIERGHPYDRYKGKPIYENQSYIPSDDPMYALESTNYYNSHFERNKGWLTYYYQAVFLKLFGFSQFVARLPFIILFIPSLLLVFYLAKSWFDDSVALGAVLFYALSYHGIFYESQARYYSLVIFFSTVGAGFVLSCGQH